MNLARSEAVEVLASITGTRLLVVGDVMLDRYQWGEVTRMSPEAPVPIVSASTLSERWGGASLASGVASGLGAVVELVGMVGGDVEGELLSEIVSNAGIAASFVLDGERATTVKTRIYARGQQLLRLDRESLQPLSDAVVEQLVGLSVAAVERSDAVLLSDYGKGVCCDEVIRAVVAEAGRLGRPVVVDPKSAIAERYEGASVVTPNLHELGLLAGRTISADDPAAIEAAGRDVRSLISCENLLVTLGADGMLLVGSSVDTVPSVAQEVFDIAGAGDAVAATVAAGLGAGGGVLATARLASVVAGLVVRKVGASDAPLAEVRATLATASF